MSTQTNSTTASSPASSPSTPGHSLPEVIQEYIAAANTGRIEEAAACFTLDALVHDENKDHQGVAAIRDWITQTTREFKPHNEVLSASNNGESHHVISTISGNFPGSPAELPFHYVLSDGKISRLSIG